MKLIMTMKIPWTRQIVRLFPRTLCFLPDSSTTVFEFFDLSGCPDFLGKVAKPQQDITNLFPQRIRPITSRGASPATTTLSLLQPSRSPKSAEDRVVCPRARWPRPRPGVRRPAGSSSQCGTARLKTPSASVRGKVSAAGVDIVAQCRFAAAPRPRVSGSGHRADSTPTSDNEIQIMDTLFATLAHLKLCKWRHIHWIIITKLKQLKNQKQEQERLQFALEGCVGEGTQDSERTVALN